MGEGKLKIQVDFLDENPHYPFATRMRSGFGRAGGLTHAEACQILGLDSRKVFAPLHHQPLLGHDEKNAFKRVGLFDEALPVCEDYDFWLRISSRFPIFFINRKLIVKRGDILINFLQRSWGNDRYRVIALEKLLSESHLSPEEREMVLEEMKRKCQILSEGFFKRGNVIEGSSTRDHETLRNRDRRRPERTAHR